ncbi:MAG: tetratricopeptide repeat protein [Chitinophagales bacterium]|nr:tetratricopeptide repeat protein [Chitinophagaceae bacterium]MCB9063526.1 tetratricopeptide repeat protein [Chitinophagales bacterium]
MDRAKRLIFILLLSLSVAVPASAQSIWPTPEVEQLYKEARDFHSRGNLREAIIRYQQAIQIAPDIVLLHRELAHSYYLAKGYDEAIATLDPIIKQQKADAETYKIMTECLIAIGEEKKAKKLLRQGVEALPNAGVLYHQMGLMYESNNEVVYALESWLDGIERDPTYHLNYYEAARTYMKTNKTVWAIIYAEMFINIEQQTPRSYDTRRLLLESYQKLFNTVATGTVPKFGATGRETGPVGFEEAVYDTYIKLSPVMSDGITTENLIMLRTRFLMDWTVQYAERFPHSLFARHDDFVRNGYFDMYNQWLFGKVENLQQYDAWMKFHENAMPRFETRLRQSPYKPLKSDFYNDKVVDGIFDK